MIPEIWTLIRTFCDKREYAALNLLSKAIYATSRYSPINFQVRNLPPLDICKLITNIECNSTTLQFAKGLPLVTKITLYNCSTVNVPDNIKTIDFIYCMNVKFKSKNDTNVNCYKCGSNIAIVCKNMVVNEAYNGAQLHITAHNVTINKSHGLMMILIAENITIKDCSVTHIYSLRNVKKLHIIDTNIARLPPMPQLEELTIINSTIGESIILTTQIIPLVLNSVVTIKGPHVDYKN